MNALLNRAQHIQPVSLSDQRIKRIQGMIRVNKNKSDALIEILHIAQDTFGYLPLEVIVYIAKELKIPPSRVYGVVTFYHFFSLKPKGEHQCLVCTGTACYVKGADKILEKLYGEFGLKPGEVTQDNKLGLQTARCIGSCGLAPAAVLDNEILPKVDANKIAGMVRAKMESVQ